MKKPRKLLVICEPHYVAERKCTRNRSTNNILIEYSKYFEEVHCLCPGDDNKMNRPSSINVHFHTLKGYDGNRINKFLFLFKDKSDFLFEVIDQLDIDLVQFRVPSLLSMSLFKKFRKLNLPYTVYVAGDIFKCLVGMFPSVPFIKYIALFLKNKQINLLRNSIAVTAGDVLKSQYETIASSVHAYYSTTHVDVLRSNNALQQRNFNVCYIGRIDRAKRFQDLIQAANVLKTKIPNLKIHVLGTGDDTIVSELKTMISKSDLNTFFIFHGYLSDKIRIDEILLQCHTLVLPSITEGTPKVLPESMSRGVVPIAVKNVGSINHIIKDYHNGLLVSPKSPSEIATKLEELSLNKELFIQIQKNALQYAENTTMQIEIEKLWAFVFASLENKI